MRRRWLASLIPIVWLAVAVVAAAWAGGAPSATSASTAATASPTVVLDRFEATFNNVNGTNYKAVVSSKDNAPVLFTWKMEYVAGRCGDFTVDNGTVFEDKESVQEYTVTPAIDSQGYFDSTAFYNHDGCPSDVESAEKLTLDIYWKDPGSASSCQLEYSQNARDHDNPPVPQENPPTTNTGDCTYTPPPPPAPPPPPPPPPPPAGKAPKFTKAEKEEFRQKALGFSGAGATAGVAGLATVEFPPVAAICIITAGVEALTAEYYTAKYLDPPDPNYKRITNPTFPKPPLLKPGGGTTPAMANAANALLQNTARVAGEDRAFLDAIQRAQGAYAAGDAVWLKKQSSLAAGYARQEAKLLDARPALEASLRASLVAAGLNKSVTPSEANAARTKPLPATLVSLFRAFGLGGRQIAAFQAQLGKVTASAAGPVAPKIAPPAVAAAEHAGARLLNGLAARLAKL